MFKDAGNQSMWWSGFSGILAWLGDQQNLMLLSLAIGILTALVNMYDKCKQGKVRERAEAREEEIHKLTVQQLKKRLKDE